MKKSYQLVVAGAIGVLAQFSAAAQTPTITGASSQPLCPGGAVYERITWTATNADNFVLQTTYTGSGSGPWYNLYSGTATFHKFGPEPVGSYAARVQACQGETCGDFYYFNVYFPSYRP